MSTSRLPHPASGMPPSSPQVDPKRAEIRGLIGLSNDCLQRALDSLTVLDDFPIDTGYLFNQLSQAVRHGRHAMRAAELLNKEIEDDDGPASDAAAETPTAIQPAQPAQGADEGGAA